MPRLRRLKDYEIDFSDCRPESSDEADAAPRATGPSQGYETTDETNCWNQKGWWSNESIIASMDDNKLRQAIVRYREVLALCERELIRRGVMDSQQRRRFTRQNGPLDYQTTRKPTSARARNQTRLTPEQMLKTLEILIQLKTNQNKGETK